MHGSLGHFKATLQRKKERKAKAEGRFDNRRLNYKASENKAEFDFPKLSKPELDKVKIEIKHKIRREKILNSIFVFAVFLIILISFYILLF
ncbi:hypothetical protein [Hwangdonia lutea]|uniref:Uncharacterized protein n=1 Tax=Hwangdonia lutea TaxID=3075823 RepID=A0AA97EL09_9FLAO|nr:hypothetical protein [Hwangdonia sp. SCSIO 19198]WOD43042.1 hypothetical protein RNZ46_13700 [Hwangdonia sp. SCSIO 19198]